MFRAVHITRIQIYPFPEPVLAPRRLQGVSQWPVRLGKREDKTVHREPDIFSYVPALRKWLRQGYRIHVPGYGSMKALRKPHNPYDAFYKPFGCIQNWLGSVRLPSEALRCVGQRWLA